MIRWTFNARFFAPENEGGTGGADSGVGAPATDSNTQNPVTTTTDDVMATLKHDPFPGGEASKETKDAAAKAGAKPEPKAGKGAGAKAKSPDGQAQSPEPGTSAPTEDPEKIALKQSLEHATALLDSYKRNPAPSNAPDPAKAGTGAAPKAGTGAPTGAAPETPTYDFTIPDQLVEALTSSDPKVFKGGVAGFAKGIALGVHREFSQHIEKMMPAILEKLVPQMIQTQMQTTNERQTIFNDFYGTYKELNNPKLYPLIAQTTMEVQRELRTDQWTPAVRDTVAKRVKEVIAAVGGAVPSKPLAPGSKHPVLGGGGNSRVAVETSTSLEKEIADTLFAGYN